MIRRLPITVRPAQQETVTSYVRRLAALHSIGYRDLWQHLSASVPYSGTSKRRQLIVAQRLVAATGHQLAALAHAMPELRDPAPRWRELRHLPQRACPVCTARHPGGPVVRFFAHHEFVCTRHGYWIGPPVPTIPDLRPRQLARLVPELVTAQRRHTRLLRRRGWRHVFNAFDVSIAVCVDRRFQQRIDVPGRRSWQERIDLLIPTRTRFNTSVFLAAFYPEIVNLARLFCSPTWRAVARRALTSAEHRLTITAEISRQIGPEPVPHNWPVTQEWTGYETDRWLRAMAGLPDVVVPNRTFPQTRRVTFDGVPVNHATSDETLAKKANKEFNKHRHVPSWALPNYADRPTNHDLPLDYQPEPEHHPRLSLSQLLDALIADSAK